MYEQVLQAGRVTATSQLHGDSQDHEPLDCANRSAGILVMAFGNSMRGDDGIGPAVLQALAQRDDLPQAIVLLDGDAWTLASELQTNCYQRVILLDALEMGCPPGAWQRLDLSEHRSYVQKARQQADSHQLNLDTLLALFEIIEVPLPELIVYGIQPQAMGWSAELSANVQKTIPPLCDQILKDLTKDAFYG
jgi:hydrogenase maturation protease